MAKFDEILKDIQGQLPEKIEINVNKTICNATQIRQCETAKIAKDVDAMIIIGGKKSSNTQKLVEISKEYCKKVYFIQSINDLDIKNIREFSKIGIMAGASTPNYLIEEVKNVLDKN